MTKKVTIELPYETLDDIVLETLKETYERCSNEVEILNNKERYLELYERGDLAHSKEIRDAAKALIYYFSTPDQAKEYFGVKEED